MRVTFRHQRNKGQVLILACLVFLVLALMMMAGFALASSIHERTRLQAAADAHAFSVAVLEARAFNTIAYMNRAIAGAIVAELGLYAWKSIALRDVSMYKAGADAFVMIAAQEKSLCPFPPYWNQHCTDWVDALKILAEYQQEWRKAEDELKRKDNEWDDAVSGFSKMIKTIYDDEKDILTRTKLEIGDGSQTLRAMAKQNASEKALVSVERYNVVGLACAVEGSGFDGDCNSAPSWKQRTASSPREKRFATMESAARAARPDFEVGVHKARHLSGDGYNNGTSVKPSNVDFHSPVSNPKKMMKIQGNEGEYKEDYQDTNKTTLANNEISADVGDGSVSVMWRDGKGKGSTKGYQAGRLSDDDPCEGQGACFIGFRSTAQGGETDYGQPATYGAFRQSLRSAKGAWEIEGKGEVNMPGMERGTFNYVAEGSAFAVAKGKTYFHQLGDWEVPPNLFDPFWRAKLHPFKRDELSEMLGHIGDEKGQQLISGGQTSVEGVVQ